MAQQQPQGLASRLNERLESIVMVSAILVLSLVCLWLPPDGPSAAPMQPSDHRISPASDCPPTPPQLRVVEGKVARNATFGQLMRSHGFFP